MEAKTFHLSDKEHLYQAAFTEDGKYVGVAFGNGGVGIFSRESFDTPILLRSAVGSQFDMPCTYLKWVKTEGAQYSLLSSSSQGSVTLWSWNGTELEAVAVVEEEGNEPLCIDVSPDGKWIATGGKDRIVRLYNRKLELVSLLTKKKPDDFSSVTAHNNRIFSVRFVNSNLLVSAGWESPVQVWDLRSFCAERQIFGIRTESDCVETMPPTTSVVLSSANSECPIKVVEVSTAVELKAESARLSKTVPKDQTPLMTRFCRESCRLWRLFLHSVDVVDYNRGTVIGTVSLPSPANSITTDPVKVGRALVVCQKGVLVDLKVV